MRFELHSAVVGGDNYGDLPLGASNVLDPRLRFPATLPKISQL